MTFEEKQEAWKKVKMDIKYGRADFIYTETYKKLHPVIQIYLTNLESIWFDTMEERYG